LRHPLSLAEMVKNTAFWRIQVPTADSISMIQEVRRW
jgi:hypothetical protein